MSTAARKARKRAGIPFERTQKTPSRAYETPQGKREGRRTARQLAQFSDTAIAAALAFMKGGQR